MKTITLDLEQLAVDTFATGGPGQIVPLTQAGGSEFTICSACPTGQFSCLETCGFSCAGSCFLKAC